MSLSSELEKMGLLEKYKKGLCLYITKYLYVHAGILSKDAGRIFRKSFGRWYFDGIRTGKIVDFIPTQDIVHVRDLQYLFQKVERAYVTYKPFIFHFGVGSSSLSASVPSVVKSYEREGSCEKVTFQADKYKYTISILQYGRLRDLYSGPPGYLNESILILLMRYGFIGSKNNHLSVPPALIHGKTVELFGSPLNTCTLRYCSPLGMDCRFGSLGSFFNYTLQSGTYLANPPFVEGVMTEMAEKLLDALETVKNLTIYVVIPVWDVEAVVRGLTYEAWELLKLSPHLRDHRVLEQYNYPFYDYYEDQYIPVANTHLILLSNDTSVQHDLTDFVERWAPFQDKIVPLVDKSENP